MRLVCCIGVHCFIVGIGADRQVGAVRIIIIMSFVSSIYKFSILCYVGCSSLVMCVSKLCVFAMYVCCVSYVVLCVLWVALTTHHSSKHKHTKQITGKLYDDKTIFFLDVHFLVSLLPHLVTKLSNGKKKWHPEKDKVNILGNFLLMNLFFVVYKNFGR